MSNNLFRDTISLDWDDLFTFLVALTGLIAVFRIKRTQAKNLNRTEVVDAGVLEQFASLFERIGVLETRLEQATVDLSAAREEIKELQRLEAYLDGKVREREKEVSSLKRQLEAARIRIKHLEDVCRRAGINGDDLE